MTSRKTSFLCFWASVNSNFFCLLNSGSLLFSVNFCCLSRAATRLVPLPFRSKISKALFIYLLLIVKRKEEDDEGWRRNRWRRVGKGVYCRLSFSFLSLSPLAWNDKRVHVSVNSLTPLQYHHFIYNFNLNTTTECWDRPHLGSSSQTSSGGPMHCRW